MFIGSYVTHIRTRNQERFVRKIFQRILQIWQHCRAKEDIEKQVNMLLLRKQWI